MVELFDMKEELNLLYRIMNTRIKEFVDLNELVKSQLFSEILEYCALHAVQHGDKTNIDNILKIFKGTRSHESLVKFFCARCGFEFKSGNGIVIFTKSTTPAKEETKFIAPENTKKSTEQKKKKAKPKKIDMLDSWARLPGSYGTGKKR